MNTPAPLDEFRAQLLQLRDRFGSAAVYYTQTSAPELRPIYQTIAGMMVETANLMEIAHALTDDQARHRARARQAVGDDLNEWGVGGEKGLGQCALPALEREVAV
jgi:hypothetical protein